jgi:hypothetical protein
MADSVSGVKRRTEVPVDSDAKMKVARAPPASTMVVLPHLKAYYKNLFPCELFYRWLSYGKGWKSSVNTYPYAFWAMGAYL